jgi:hypothetical protein
MTAGFAGTISSGGTSSWYARAVLGQTFTVPAGNNITITSIFIPGVYFRLGTGCINAKIYTDISKTTLLDTSTTSICDTDASTERTGTAGTGSLTFSGAATLTSGTLYYFELYPTTAGQAFWTNQTSPGAYAGGDLLADGGLKTSYDNAFTITYSDVIVAPVITGLTANNSPAFGSLTTLMVNVESDSRVTYFANGKRITNCINLRATGSGNSYSSTCSWKPTFRGAVIVTATALPASAATPVSIPVQKTMLVGRRTSLR